MFIMNTGCQFQKGLPNYHYYLIFQWSLITQITVRKITGQQ